MSSKLAQFFHDNRHQSVSVQLNISDVRKSVEEMILLLFPEPTQERISPKGFFHPPACYTTHPDLRLRGFQKKV